MVDQTAAVFEMCICFLGRTCFDNLLQQFDIGGDHHIIMHRARMYKCAFHQVEVSVIDTVFRNFKREAEKIGQ